MDGDEKPGDERCGIPVDGREKLSIGLGAGRTMGAYDANDKTKVYWCRCGAQQFCAFQELALRLDSANQGNQTGGDGEKETRSGRVRRLQRESNTVGRTAPPNGGNA